MHQAFLMASNSAGVLDDREMIPSDPTFHRQADDLASMNIVNIVSGNVSESSKVPKGAGIGSINELVEESYDVMEDEAGDDFEE